MNMEAEASDAVWPNLAAELQDRTKKAEARIEAESDMKARSYRNQMKKQMVEAAELGHQSVKLTLSEEVVRNARVLETLRRILVEEDKLNVIDGVEGVESLTEWEVSWV